MIIFLFGPDTFRSKRKLQEIIKEYRLKHKSGLNFVQIEAKEEKSFEEFKKRVETASMFEETKLIVFKNTLSLPKDFQEKIKNYLKERKLFEKDNIVLIFFEEEDVKKNSSLYKFLAEKSFKTQEFKELPPAKLNLWIQKEAKNLGGTIEPKAIERLIFFFGDDLWQIGQELKKLIAFKNKEKITQKDVETLCRENLDPNIFETIEAISQKNKKRALKLLSEHLETDENALRILSMIVYQFRNLIKIKSFTENSSFSSWQFSYQASKILGLHPFVIKKTLPIAQQFSMEELKNIYQKLLELDYQIKTGKIAPEVGIEMFVTTL
ncbi:MAG TPA: DNA polymerase III subunit delta [Candidatus Pacearchaeota archaeon]|nr:DNA polymerase III subunit delta [Candidatus Pacearchaeota archaeon]HOK94322.1 DNA polymerase III subunit delta [Candidatus Pacearchaeota archaeon]HPO75322.1 DNA polymerase III subunit delta [Candidatus Pacearchaeota archaeon]